ncbi:hypothetical protein LOK49_LG14G00674 [Camellia lanceoleosa]|uniref:Uncharacterized protein n=1 Tax=Camellia lanceoleosa TaxID=1840588 RepID=A0ACC0F9D6_9ERIC|nr:hypothetical protein LOK49_LG14G00674 [Camellia lanceoleosa]
MSVSATHNSLVSLDEHIGTCDEKGESEKNQQFAETEPSTETETQNASGKQSGLLKGDDLSDRFFRCLTELSVSHCLSSEVISSSPLQSPQQVQSLSFLAIDIYSKLVLSIIKPSS